MCCIQEKKLNLAAYPFSQEQMLIFEISPQDCVSFPSLQLGVQYKLLEDCKKSEPFSYPTSFRASSAAFVPAVMASGKWVTGFRYSALAKKMLP